jgi:hypothetical protein
MTRLTLLSFILLSLLAAAARAADPAPYAVTAEATRSGDAIWVSLKIVENKIQSVPNVGNTNVTSVLSAPRVMLNAGQQAEIASGQPSADSKGKRPPVAWGSLESGVRTEIISVKGQDSVLIVTTMIENKTIVWADVSTVPITAKAATATNPPATTQP